MGTEYYVACRTCKVVRDLDKFYAFRKAENVEDAKYIAADIEDRHAYRAALLVSFMAEHAGHNCTAYNEHEDAMRDETDGWTEDNRDFWEHKP